MRFYSSLFSSSSKALGALQLFPEIPMMMMIPQVRFTDY
jgi:hypothetical protein